MARPTDDKKDMSFHVRVNIETGERILQESAEQGISASEYIRNRLDGFVEQNDVKESAESDIEKELRNISLVFGIESDKLLRCVKGLLDREDLVVRNGNLSWNLTNIGNRLKEKGLL